MADTSADQRATPDDPAQADNLETGPDDYATGVPPPQFSGREHSRLIEERHVIGPYGEDELEATDENGRRWYHLRPEPRRRYDLIGLSYTWWLIWILFILPVFLPWGRGWGY
jgi:hypothetical protein